MRPREPPEVPQQRGTMVRERDLGHALAIGRHRGDHRRRLVLVDAQDI